MSKPACSARAAASPHLTARSRTSLWDSARGVGALLASGARRWAPPAPSPPSRRSRARRPCSGLPPSQGRRQPRLAAGVAELDAGHGAVLLDEGGAAGERGNELVVPQRGVADRAAAAARNLGRLHHDEAGAAHRVAAGVDEVPVGGEALDRRILVHGRDHDPVLEAHAPDLERGEQHRLGHRGFRPLASGAGTVPGHYSAALL